MAEYIEREALIKRFKELGLGENSFMERIFADGVYSVLENFPSANVAPVVHGKWAHLGGDEWCCTGCGFVIATEGSWEKPTEKYCQNCGAKMDLEEEQDA